MAYSIQKKDDKFCVYNNETGDKVSEHDLRQDAVKHIRKLNAEGEKPNDGKKSKKSKKQEEHDEEHDY